jgi:RNA polymerase primary sigma factor
MHMPANASLPAIDCYLSEIDATALLGFDDERDLARRIAEGDVEARDHLARANLRLVVRIAREYVGKGLSLEDLISEGNLGLMRAVEGFDPDAGTRFSTYAVYWIKQSIRVALNKTGHVVRLPQYVGVRLNKWRQAEAILRDQLGREPAREEIARRLGLSAKQARVVQRAQKVLASGRAGGEEADLTEFAADEGAVAPDAPMSAADDLKAMFGALGGLSSREATVLRLRFGLDGTQPATLQEIGDLMGMTRERVRQIERDALATLRGKLAG